MSAARPLRALVVGLGEMGRLHASCLAATPLAELAGVCDPSATALATGPPGVPTYRSLAEALAADRRCDAAIISTPPDRHREPIGEALAGGLAVLCEKPLAATREDANALVALAAGASGRLAVGHLRRFDPRFLAVQAAIADGRIGRPLEIHGAIACPRADAQRLAGSVSLALELAVHDLDAIRWLTGEPIVRVYAEALDAFPTPGPDAVVTTVRTQGGAVASLHHSWALPDDSGIDWEFRFRVAGTDGVAEIDGRDRGLSIHPARGGQPIHPDTVLWPADGRGEIGGALRDEVACFVRWARGDVDWPVTPEEARDAVVTALAVDQSLATGAPVQL